jgi:hypothetical protein
LLVIHLKIPLADDNPGSQREPRPPEPGPGASSDMGLRSVDDLKGKSYRLRERGTDTTPKVKPSRQPRSTELS